MQSTIHQLFFLAFLFAFLTPRQSAAIYWVVEAVDTSIEVGLFASMKLDSSSPNLAHISYFDHARKQLKYARQRSGGRSWIIETIDNGGEYSSLALDSNGVPHISYYDLSRGTIKHAMRVGKGGNCGRGADNRKWRCTVVDRNGGEYTSIAVHETVPAISYYQKGRLKFARKVATGKGNCAGGSWRCLDIVDSMGGHTAIGVDSAGRALIIHNERLPDEKFGRLAYARELHPLAIPPPHAVTELHCGQEGAVFGWFCAHVPSRLATGNIGGTEQRGSPEGSTVVVGLDNTFHISVYVRESLFYVRRSSDSNWEAGNLFISREGHLPVDFVAQHPLRRSSIALDDRGIASISYQVCVLCDSSPTVTTDRFLAYSKVTGGSLLSDVFWESINNTIDPIGNAGLFSSVAIKQATGRAAIAYYDDQTRILKFAQEFEQPPGIPIPPIQPGLPQPPTPPGIPIPPIHPDFPQPPIK